LWRLGIGYPFEDATLYRPGKSVKEGGRSRYLRQCLAKIVRDLKVFNRIQRIP
jgi:hypothetical protein